MSKQPEEPNQPPTSPRPSSPGRSTSFWKRQPTSTPGTVKIVGSATSPLGVFGAQYPPIVDPKTLSASGSPAKPESSSTSSSAVSRDPRLLRNVIDQPSEPSLPDVSSKSGNVPDDDDEVDLGSRTARNNSGSTSPRATAPPKKVVDAVSTDDLANLRVSDGGTNGQQSASPSKSTTAPSTPTKAVTASESKSLPESGTRSVAEPTKSTTVNLARHARFKPVLESANVDMDALRKLCWSGIPEEIRPMCWQILMGYLPCNQDRREATLQRKRKEYDDLVNQSFVRGQHSIDKAMLRQIQIDVIRPGTTAGIFENKVVQNALERILYCWAIRHPASGYVQGINDLVSPFYSVFLSGQLGTNDLSSVNIEELDPKTLSVVEADSFWCLSKLLDGIQDNYTFAQPGIQRQIVKLKELINRVDADLYNHLQAQNVEFVQFAFRWMNCLLMREVPLRSIVRMWDTYLSEQDGFSEFHLFVCAAFLVKWSDRLKTMEFQDIMVFLQSLPTDKWDERDVELLLSEAYMWKTLFLDSPSHLRT